MQVAQLVDVADVHVLLVDLGFVEILGFSRRERIVVVWENKIYKVLNEKKTELLKHTSQMTHHEVDGATDFFGLHLVSFHAVSAEGKKSFSFSVQLDLSAN